MSESIVISPVSRQEGHAELSMEVDEDGIVTNGRYFSTTPVRGIEKMLLGRRPESAPLLSERICGVCPITHALSSVEAIDDSLKIDVPKAGQMLREICLNAHIVNSHAVHQFLVAGDYVSSEGYKEFVDNISKIRKNVQYIEDVVGGEGIHPSDIRVGGMAHNITKNTKNKIKTRIEGMMTLLEQHVDAMVGFVEDKDFPDNLGEHPQPVFASSNTYGTKSNISLHEIEEILPNTWYDDESIGKKASSLIPLYKGNVVETGPRARANKFRNYKVKGVKAQHIARANEMIDCAERILELINKLDPSAKVMANYSLEGTDRLGVGVIEGPKGTTIHTARISQSGFITDYNIIAASTWNVPTMGIATEGFHHDFAPHIIRAYDPCMSCATHMIVKNDQGND